MSYENILKRNIEALYQDNFYTEQLPMRRWDSPFYIPSNNQLLFNIFKQTSKTGATLGGSTSAETPPSDSSTPPVPPTGSTMRKSGPQVKTSSASPMPTKAEQDAAYNAWDALPDGISKTRAYVKWANIQGKRQGKDVSAETQALLKRAEERAKAKAPAPKKQPKKQPKKTNTSAQTAKQEADAKDKAEKAKIKEDKAKATAISKAQKALNKQANIKAKADAKKAKTKADKAKAKADKATAKAIAQAIADKKAKAKATAKAIAKAIADKKAKAKATSAKEKADKAAAIQKAFNKSVAKIKANQQSKIDIVKNNKARDKAIADKAKADKAKADKAKTPAKAPAKTPAKAPAKTPAKATTTAPAKQGTQIPITDANAGLTAKDITARTNNLVALSNAEENVRITGLAESAAQAIKKGTRGRAAAMKKALKASQKAIIERNTRNAIENSFKHKHNNHVESSNRRKIVPTKAPTGNLRKAPAKTTKAPKAPHGGL